MVNAGMGLSPARGTASYSWARHVAFIMALSIQVYLLKGTDEIDATGNPAMA